VIIWPWAARGAASGGRTVSGYKVAYGPQNSADIERRIASTAAGQTKKCVAGEGNSQVCEPAALLGWREDNWTSTQIVGFDIRPDGRVAIREVVRVRKYRRPRTFMAYSKRTHEAPPTTPCPSGAQGLSRRQSISWVPWNMLVDRLVSEIETFERGTMFQWLSPENRKESFPSDLTCLGSAQGPVVPLQVCSEASPGKVSHDRPAPRQCP